MSPDEAKALAEREALIRLLYAAEIDRDHASTREASFATAILEAGYRLPTASVEGDQPRGLRPLAPEGQGDPTWRFDVLRLAVAAILAEYIDEPAAGAPPEVHHIANSGWKNVVPKWLALRTAYLSATPAGRAAKIDGANAPSLPEGWIAVDTVLPEDGVDVEVRYRNGETEIGHRRQDRQCMLGARAGEVGPGWVSKASGYLPIFDVTHWRPEPAQSRGANAPSSPEGIDTRRARELHAALCAVAYLAPDSRTIDAAEKIARAALEADRRAVSGG